MQDVVLLKITKIVDDDTGIWNIGELDFGKTAHCSDYLREKPENREKLTEWLRWLANACEKSKSPFSD